MSLTQRFALLLLLSLGAGCAGKGKGEAPQQPPVPVGVLAITERAMPIEVQGVGNVEAFSSVLIRSQVSGEITKVLFREGDFVPKGTALFQIDPRPFQVAAQQAEAVLARAQAEAANARTEAARNEAMLKNNLVSEEAAEQARARAATANAALKAAQAGVAAAKLQVSYASIRSPIAGRTGRLLVHVGDVVKNNDAVLVSVNQLSPIYVAFNIPERFLDPVQAALHKRPVEVFAESSTGQTKAAGKLTFIDNAVNTATGTIFMKAQFENRRGELWPGQFANVTLLLGRQADAIAVPTAAILSGQQGDYVYVVGEDSTAQVRLVTVDRVSGDDSIIAKGLAAGDRVVVDGQSRLMPKGKIEIKHVAGSETKQ